MGYALAQPIPEIKLNYKLGSDLLLNRPLGLCVTHRLKVDKHLNK